MGGVEGLIDCSFIHILIALRISCLFSFLPLVILVQNYSLYFPDTQDFILSFSFLLTT